MTVVLTRSRDGDARSQDDDQMSETNTSWSLSAIFGAAAVATGGYHLAIARRTVSGTGRFHAGQGERPTNARSARRLADVGDDSFKTP